jgi:hypothetical protein
MIQYNADNVRHTTLEHYPQRAMLSAFYNVILLNLRRHAVSIVASNTGTTDDLYIHKQS